MLTNIAIRNAKPSSKPCRLYDSGGLYLEIAPTGGKWWRFKYRYAGKEKRLSLGVYPEVSLSEARERRDENRKLLAQGTDPSLARKQEKLLRHAQSETFELIALEWFERFNPKWTQSYADEILRWFKKDLLPSLGALPINEVTPAILLATIRRIEARGAVDTAHRVLQICSQVFRYAVVCGKAERDPAGDLRGALTPTKKKHYASITDPRELGGLLRAIDGYNGSHVVRCALQLAPLLFVRPGELRRAEWSEIDFEEAQWRIPAEKMKMRMQHIVPLSKQALDILDELHPLTSLGRFIFPGVRSSSRPMSGNAVTAALRYMGYSSDQVTGHGFRSTASTLLNEQGWNRDAIERQLAHAERNNVRAAYNFAEFLPERRKMMQAWADYLDGLREDGRVINLHRTASGE